MITCNTGMMQVIQKMMENETEFFLTGSRAFGTSTVKSDFDFFTEHSTSTIVFLENLGFTKLDKYYGDDEDVELFDSRTVTVYRWWGYREGQVDVQFVKNVGVKIDAQAWINRLLKKNRTINYLSINRATWELAYLMIVDLS